MAARVIINSTFALEKVIIMATAIKAIPTLKGKEAQEFLQNAEKAEHSFDGSINHDLHPFCQMAKAILSKAGML